MTKRDQMFYTFKPFVLVEVLYCEENETVSKHFIKKLKPFTNYRFNYSQMVNEKDYVTNEPKPIILVRYVQTREMYKNVGNLITSLSHHN